ncbi:MAG: helix-turn-helix domain-containing protein [Acidobacteria bacterium]|nr:helix-turn-helix domain-containing protein [Acidobacteriota bacterium]
MSVPSAGSQLAQLDEAVHLGNLGRGTELYEAGDPADRVLILREGRVKTWVHGPGGKHCLFQIVEPGEIFGEEGLVGGDVRSASAEVLERSAITMVPTRAAVRFAEETPEFWTGFADLLQKRVRRLEEQLQWVSFLEVEQRIARLLLRWTQDELAECVELRLSQKDLAGLIGATRETTSSALNRLQRAGCIDIRRRCVAVRSYAGLRAHCGELEQDRDHAVALAPTPLDRVRAVGR